MNIKDFLIDNYIWILVIILITIVTIIGFLADKKKSGNKKENNKQQQMPLPTNMETQPVNNGKPMQYQQTAQPGMDMSQTNNNNNMQMNNALNNNNQNIGTIPQPANIIPNMGGTLNNPQPVENITGNVEKESMYQPLSEQTPNITPQPVPNFTTMSNNNMTQNINPMQPTMPSTEEPIPDVINQNNMPMAAPMSPIQPMINDQVAMPTYNTQSPMQPINNNSGVNTNMMPNNNTTIPQPVNPIPTPQPVMPQSIIQQPAGVGSYNQQQMMPQNLNQQIQQPNPNMTMPQPTQQAPVNFVFGPQNNNPKM